VSNSKSPVGDELSPKLFCARFSEILALKLRFTLNSKAPSSAGMELLSCQLQVVFSFRKFNRPGIPIVSGQTINRVALQCLRGYKPLRRAAYSTVSHLVCVLNAH
jgi:hypothetical protein